MSQFFKKTEIPTEGRQQSAQATGNTVDTQAHADADNNRGGFAGAVNDLLGISNKVLDIKNKINKDERDIMESKFSLRADADVTDFGSFSKSFISSKAAEDGKSVEDYSDDELDGFMGEIKSSYVDSKKLNEKEYYGLISSRLDSKSTVILSTQKTASKGLRQKKSFDSLFSTVSNNFMYMEPQAFKDSLDDTMATAVGPFKEIQDTQENVKQSILGRLMTTLVETDSGDPMFSKTDEMLAKLESDELREFFDLGSDYDKLLNIARQQAQSSLNKKKSLNFDKVEEQAWGMSEAGAFTSKKDVDDFFGRQKWKEGHSPSKKDMFKLRKDLLKGVSVEINFQEAFKELKSGNSTYIKSKGFNKEQREAIEERLQATETGIRDTSAEGYNNAFATGKDLGNIRDYANKGLPYSPSMIDYFNSPVTGSIENVKSRIIAFNEVMAATHNTTNSIASVVTPKQQASFRFMNDIIEKLDNGVIDKMQFADIKSKFEINRNKSIDATTGRYKSIELSNALSSKSNKEWLSDVSKNVDWTWEDNTASAYAKEEISSNLGMGLAAGMSIEEAKTWAVDTFESQHDYYESSDNTEGIIPKKWRSVIPESLTEVAVSLPELQKYRKASLLGTDYEFRREISVRPTLDYAITNRMAVFFKGKQVANTSMTLKQFEHNWSGMKGERAKQIREDYITRQAALRERKEEEYGNISKTDKIDEF